MTDQTHWLTESEEQAWRAYIEGTLTFLDQLDRELRADHGISNHEYEVLVRLSEAPDRTLRMAELAISSSQSRSRLSHTISRMEKNGIVKRKTCGEDGRGVYATLTEAGWNLTVEAAKSHLRGVRKYFVDVVDPRDFQAIGRAFARVRHTLEQEFQRPNHCPTSIPSIESQPRQSSTSST